MAYRRITKIRHLRDALKAYMATVHGPRACVYETMLFVKRKFGGTSTEANVSSVAPLSRERNSVHKRAQASQRQDGWYSTLPM